MKPATKAFSAAMTTIKFFSDEDPSRLHYQIAREVLREEGGEELEREERARDLLARSLVRECNRFFCAVSVAFGEKGEGTWLDEVFSAHLKEIGTRGRRLAAEILSASSGWQKTYLQTGEEGPRFKLWTDPTIIPYGCRYVKILAEVLWRDSIESQFCRTKKHIPAITQSVQRPISRLLSPCSEPRPGSIVYEGKVVAEVAAIDPKLMPIVMRGAKSLNSIYHHKLIRFECRSGFENWIQAKPDPRVMRHERGETEIAEILGFKFKEAPTIIKALLHAQAHMLFYFDDGSRGNLISLRDYRSNITHREEGVEIVLGTQLMPYYTFQTDRRGKLLVPVPELPPFVSAPQYHAGQALLQMLIMEEFTNKSIELATEGTIEIGPEKWWEFLKQSGLPEAIFKHTKERWMSDGDDGHRFLICLHGHRFTLGKRYEKELMFLKAQGNMRKERRKQGQISVSKRPRRLNTCI